MLRLFCLGMVVIGLSGCMETTNTSFSGLSGQLASTAKCNSSSVSCLQKAAEACGSGPYQVLESESHAGGLLADTNPGPFTWYSMTYRCGPSDGKMPTFAFRGPQYVEPAAPATVNVQSSTTDAPRLSPPIRCESRRVGGMVETTC